MPKPSERVIPKIQVRIDILDTIGGLDADQLGLVFARALKVFPMAEIRCTAGSVVAFVHVPADDPQFFATLVERSIAFREQIQDVIREQLTIPRLRSAVEQAWGIIANAGGGNWLEETDEWRAAAVKWRDEFIGKP